jgi:hypothetical protein
VEVPRDPAKARLTELGALFTAARAALFARSIEAGEPELALSAAAVSESLGESGPRTRAAAQAAFTSLSACRLEGAAPDAQVVAEFREVVRGLPAFS